MKLYYISLFEKLAVLSKLNVTAEIKKFDTLSINQRHTIHTKYVVLKIHRISLNRLFERKNCAHIKNAQMY